MSKKVIMSLLGLAAVIALLYFFPWRDITWGKLVMSQERVVVVSGYAESKEKNQIASFNAGVYAAKDNKDEAVKEVNDKIAAITKALKEFGIEEDDIKTESMSIYQGQDAIWENGVQRSKPGQWNVNNNISVVLRKIERANSLTDLLTKSGATNVYGPSFQLDTSKKAENGLIAEAIEDARVKAEAMAKASGANLGKIVSVSEGGSSTGGVYPMYAYGERGGGGGADLQPGSSTISKTVTVVWSLR